jgi:hypothetical protein
MENQIIITNRPEIRLNDSFFEFNIEEANISIDMRALFSSNTYSEDAWIHVTPILKSNWSPVSKIADWLRNDNLKEYINIVNNEFFNSRNLRTLKHAPKSQWLKTKWLDNGKTPLVLTRRGRHNSGTWLHKELFMEFITSLRPDYRRELHKMVMHIIKTAEIMKITRKDTKVLFHPLTDAIKDIYIPAQKNENAKRYAYIHILELANLKGLGMTSKTFKKLYNLTDEKIKKDGKTSIRDYMTENQLNSIKKIEQHIHGLIVYAEITDYQALKSKILENF